jgi:hypothetical protein
MKPIKLDDNVQVPSLCKHCQHLEYCSNNIDSKQCNNLIGKSYRRYLSQKDIQEILSDTSNGRLELDMDPIRKKYNINLRRD